MESDLTAMLEAGSYSELAGAVMLGLVGALFVALLWLRFFRWALGVFGLGA